MTTLSKPAKAEVAKAKPRRKDGRFKRIPKPKAKPTCTVSSVESGACHREQLARGMCRMHYDRWRKWGDPLTTGVPGGPRTVPDALEEYGVTPRQRHYWASQGVIELEQDAAGRYIWTADDLAMVKIIKDLSALGLSLDLCGQVARLAVKERADRIEIAPGIVIELTLPDPDDPF